MKIPFKIIDDYYVVHGQVKIPDQLINCSPIDAINGFIDIPHVRSGAFTKVFGDAPILFHEETKLTTNLFGELVLPELGFEQRGPAKWWNPFFGVDSEENWMDFDPKTDNLASIIPKLFRTGYAKGAREVRFAIKKALDISLI